MLDDINSFFIIIILLLSLYTDCSDQHGFSPLHYACMYGHAKVVDMFLHRGARTDIVNMGGNSLLHMAAQYGKYDVLIKVLYFLYYKPSD